MKKSLVFSGLIAAAVASSSALAADQHIRLTECPLAVSDVHTLALLALQKRRYNVEEDTPTMLVGEQDDLKVEIIFADTTDIVIRWTEGFGNKNDQWLRNLKTDILWEMAE
jgi:hypothetical protein